METAALLAVLATRGEQAPELAGFVDVMREQSVPVPLDRRRARRTGRLRRHGRRRSAHLQHLFAARRLLRRRPGPRSPSTATAPSPRAAARPTCLRHSGVPIDLSPELAAECLRETGFVFLFAPLYHPAMKALGPLRRALGFRTIFNLCGPLTNPAHARTQVIGVLAPSRVLLVGRALAALGAKRAFVVHGSDGIDELTTTGESVVARIEETGDGGEPTLKAARVTPEMAGLPRATLDQFTGGDIPTNTSLLYDVITGIPGRAATSSCSMRPPHWWLRDLPAI